MRYLAGLFVIVLLLGGCGLMSGNDVENYLGRDDSGDTPILERGSFEDSRARLDEMADLMAARMTEVFPDCVMTRRGKEDDITGVGSQDYEYAGVWPYSMYSQSRLCESTISDTRERADKAIEIVTSIAVDYGFRPHITYNDRIAPDGEGYVAFEGWNAAGDKYRFGSAVFTNISYDMAQRFTAKQLEAIEAGLTPSQEYPADPSPSASGPPPTT